MSVVLGSNIASLRAQRQLGIAADGLSRSFERLASGMRINRASDDAAGLAISNSLNASSRISSTAIRNANDGISSLSIADGALSQQSGIITRMMELSMQSTTGTLSNNQRKTLQAEYRQLQLEYFRIADTTKFNGVNLLQGGSINLQVGLNGTDQMLSTANLRISRDIGVIDLERASSRSQRGNDGWAAVNGGAPLTREQLEQTGITTYFTTATDDQGRTREVALQITAGHNNPNQAFVLLFARSLTNPNQWNAEATTAEYSVWAGGGNVTINSDGTFSGVGGDYTGTQNSFSYTQSGSGEQFTLDLSGIRLKNSSAGITPSSDLPLLLDTYNIHSESNSLSIDGAKDSLDGLRAIQDFLSSMRGMVGASMSRLSTAISNLQTMRENFNAAESRIKDVDVANEAGDLTKLQILQQVGSAILSQANQSPALVLQLLR